MKGFVNFIIVLFLFIPLVIYILQYEEQKQDLYLEKLKYQRLAYYYDDIVYDFENIIGASNIYYRMVNSTAFVLTIDDRYRVSDYTGNLSQYESEVNSYLYKIGLGYSVSFDSLTNYNDYGDIYLATKSGNLNSYYRRYLTSTGNASVITIYYNEVGKPTYYDFEFYILEKVPFIDDNFVSNGESSDGVPIHIKMCYPYLASTECKEYTTTLGQGGTASYTATFHLNVCDGELNITVALSGIGNDHDEVYIHVPQEIGTDVNITLNGTTVTSDYDFSQLFCGKRENDDTYLILWYGDTTKGDATKIILDEG